MRFKFMHAAAVSAVIVTGFQVSPVRADETLTVTSFGGSYADSQKKAYLEPFQQESGTKANMVDYNGGLGELRAQVTTGNVTWDVVDVEMQDLARGCDDGLFEPVGDVELSPGLDGTKPDADFIEGTLSDCGIGTVIWSTVVAYNDDLFPGEKPSKLADFFDTKKFPGKRGLMKKPQAFLEWALIADGVEPKEVYSVLATPEGLDRAFAKLNTIRGDILWWDSHAQAPQLLADKEVAMTMAANGRIYTAAVVEKKPFKVIWDHQIWFQDYWAIPKGSKNREAARSFIAFASRPQQMAVQAGMIPYGPTRKSAVTAVDEAMKPYLPTEASNFANAMANDVQFWADHGDEINEKFNVWLNQ